jgi:hypothetical protein
MRLLSAFGVVASLAILAGSANAQKVPPQLLGSKAIEAITGSTISFYGNDSVQFVMFIAADHTVDMLKKKPQQKNERSTFEWSSNKAGQLCVAHETPCYTIKVYGVQGLIGGGNKELFNFNIEPGNQVDAYAAKG